MLFIGKGGYWEGRAGGKQGWFPALAIKEVASAEDLRLMSQREWRALLRMDTILRSRAILVCT